MPGMTTWAAAANQLEIASPMFSEWRRRFSAKIVTIMKWKWKLSVVSHTGITPATFHLSLQLHVYVCWMCHRHEKNQVKGSSFPVRSLPYWMRVSKNHLIIILMTIIKGKHNTERQLQLLLCGRCTRAVQWGNHHAQAQVGSVSQEEEYCHENLSF